jgi:hypothetical protein
MKKFTKIISLALALVLSLGVLAACGGDKRLSSAQMFMKVMLSG